MSNKNKGKIYDFTNISHDEQLDQLNKYLRARELNAFHGYGLQDPFLTEEQIKRKFKLPAGVDRIAYMNLLIEEVYAFRSKSRKEKENDKKLN